MWYDILIWYNIIWHYMSRYFIILHSGIERHCRWLFVHWASLSTNICALSVTVDEYFRWSVTVDECLSGECHCRWMLVDGASLSMNVSLLRPCNTPNSYSTASDSYSTGANLIAPLIGNIYKHIYIYIIDKKYEKIYFL